MKWKKNRPTVSSVFEFHIKVAKALSPWQNASYLTSLSRKITKGSETKEKEKFELSKKKYLRPGIDRTIEWNIERALSPKRKKCTALLNVHTGCLNQIGLINPQQARLAGFEFQNIFPPKFLVAAMDWNVECEISYRQKSRKKTRIYVLII